MAGRQGKQVEENTRRISPKCQAIVIPWAAGGRASWTNTPYSEVVTPTAGCCSDAPTAENTRKVDILMQSPWVSWGRRGRPACAWRPAVRDLHCTVTTYDIIHVPGFSQIHLHREMRPNPSHPSREDEVFAYFSFVIGNKWGSCYMFFFTDYTVDHF
jgi:hypothetical protein